MLIRSIFIASFYLILDRILVFSFKYVLKLFNPTAPPPGGEYLPPGYRAAASPKGQNAIKINFIYI